MFCVGEATTLLDIQYNLITPNCFNLVIYMLYVIDNLAYNGTATQNPPNSSFPPSFSIDGNRTDGMCSRTKGRRSYLQVDTGYMSVVTTVYLTFAGKI